MCASTVTGATIVDIDMDVTVMCRSADYVLSASVLAAPRGMLTGNEAYYLLYVHPSYYYSCSAAS